MITKTEVYLLMAFAWSMGVVFGIGIMLLVILK